MREKNLVKLSAVAAARKRLEKARGDTDKNPTDAQKSTGNYSKGKVTLHGMGISLENPAGSTRSGVDQDGNSWSVVMKHDYGYIRGTRGKDNDHVDVFIGPDPDSELVFVINQVDPRTGDFDEHKVVLGAYDREEAEKIYLSNYEKNWKGMGSVVSMTIQQFKQWLEERSQNRPAKPVKLASRSPAGKNPWFDKRAARVDASPTDELEVTSFDTSEGELRVTGKTDGTDGETDAAGPRRDVLRDYLWNAENAQKDGYDPETDTWSTYSDDGHPAIGPGVRVDSWDRTMSGGEAGKLLDEKIDEHWERARRHYPEFDSLDPAARHILFDYKYMGVNAPDFYALSRSENPPRPPREEITLIENDRRERLMRELYDSLRESPRL